VHNTKAAGVDANKIAMQLEHRFGTLHDRAETLAKWLKERKFGE
jgi:hypothetical protein